MANYRRIWEMHFNACLIPGIEIHHIDGNHKNNLIENLLPVTPEEHYRIHVNNGDYGAASLISNRALLPLNEVAYIRKLAGTIGGTNSRNNQLGFFSLSKEQQILNSIKGGRSSRDKQAGIHRINNDPVLSKQNSAYAGQHAFAKKAGIHAKPYQPLSVGGTCWWYNPITNTRVRKNESPGTEWVQSMGPVSIPINKSTCKHTHWWHDTDGNLKRSAVSPGPSWKQGMK